MKLKMIVLGVCLACLSLGGATTMQAQNQQSKLVRIAEIDIDPAQLDAYKVELRQEIDASIHTEPGVLALYAVSVKDKPNQIRLFEIYAGEKAYRAHLQSAHFLKYKVATAGMVKSLTLLETDPIDLGAR